MQIEQDGQTIEVFTSEEVEAQKQAALAEATKPLADQLETAKKELEGFKNKDLNFGNLRTEKEKLETQVADLTQKIEQIPETIQQQFTEKEQAQKIDALIKKTAEGDVELEKKMRHHMETTLKGVEAKTEAEIVNKISQSWQLSTAKQPVPDVLSEVISSAGAGGMPPADNPQTSMPKELSSLAKKVAAAGGFQLTDEDIAKYDPNNKK
jgi:predicted  nucleic acid-binding Zn-ribbon protein